MKRVVIVGAAGRDFHNFNVVFRDDPAFQVVAFTATQIPDIADRFYPPSLAGKLYPAGIPVVEEKALEMLIRDEEVDVCVFSYSDVSHQMLMRLASRITAAGADFWLLGTEHTMIQARVPVVSVCAVRTGCGKSPVSRLVARELRHQGWTPVVVRHPMPYGDLGRQAVQRFATRADLKKHNCTIEECEEYEPHLAAGEIVYAGVDYEAILRQAEKEGDLLLWDGGNNDTCFYRPDLEFVVADPLRPGHELAYYPGMVNLLRADVIVINKVNSARPEDLETVRANIRAFNPAATVIEAACRVSVPAPEQVKGKQILVVEDGPTLTHGEMSYGAGVVCARQLGAAGLVDPRPYAAGSIRDVYAKYPHITSLLPAMGYSETQRRELEQTIRRVPCDLVLIATPIDLAAIIEIEKPSLRVTYEVEPLTSSAFSEVLARFTEVQERAVSS